LSALYSKRIAPVKELFPDTICAHSAGLSAMCAAGIADVARAKSENNDSHFPSCPHSLRASRFTWQWPANQIEIAGA
jgi:hypothetical protein